MGKSIARVDTVALTRFYTSVPPVACVPILWCLIVVTFFLSWVVVKDLINSVPFYRFDVR